MPMLFNFAATQRNRQDVSSGGFFFLIKHGVDDVLMCSFKGLLKALS